MFWLGGEFGRKWMDINRTFGALPLSKIFDEPVFFPLHGVPDDRTHTGKAAGLSQARERWRVYDVAREVQAAC
jgi:hypothetical protein